MRYLLLLGGMLLAEKTTVTESRVIDLSLCDTVKVEGLIQRLDVSSGKFSAYWFKKYGMNQLIITCENEHIKTIGGGKK